MKLTDLEPRWIHPDMFAFKCPHCREVMLTCKRVPMSHRDQHTLFEIVFGAWRNLTTVGTKPETAWTITGTFENLSVSPSIDASASGHWHGHIKNGEIV